MTNTIQNTALTKDDVFEALKQIVLSILPDCPEDHIQYDQSLVNLGANSMDRADIIVDTMRQLHLKIDLMSFAQAKNIGGIVDVLYGALGVVVPGDSPVAVPSSPE